MEDFNNNWGEVHENYTLEENNGKTTLKIDLNSTDEWKDFFNETWPKALDIVAELAEQ